MQAREGRIGFVSERTSEPTCNSVRRGAAAGAPCKSCGRQAGTIGWIGFRGGPGNYAKFRMSVCQLVGSGRFAVAAPYVCLDSDIAVMKGVCKKIR